MDKKIYNVLFSPSLGFSRPLMTLAFRAARLCRRARPEPGQWHQHWGGLSCSPARWARISAALTGVAESVCRAAGPLPPVL
jgi:hypothetical protein